MYIPQNYQKAVWIILMNYFHQTKIALTKPKWVIQNSNGWCVLFTCTVSIIFPYYPRSFHTKPSVLIFLNHTLIFDLQGCYLGLWNNDHIFLAHLNGAYSHFSIKGQHLKNFFFFFSDFTRYHFLCLYTCIIYFVLI